MYIDQNGKKWYKGNMHTHSTNSDGLKTPEEVSRIYKAHGYDFLALTDHWKRSETYQRDDGLLMLSGIEYNVGGADVVGGVFHIVGIGMEGDPDNLDPAKQETPPQVVIDAIHKQNGIAILAHPAWSMETLDQVLPLRDIDAVEIYNSVSGIPHNCRPYSGEIIDQLAARGRYLRCTACDDAHFYDGDECMSYIYVQADELTPEAIYEALRAGRFYATQGPRFSITVTESEDHRKKTVSVDCDPVDTVIFYTRSVFTPDRCVRDPENGVTHASFTMTDYDGFVRFECIDREGHHGFGSPIPF